MGILLATRADPATRGAAKTEAYLTQPMAWMQGTGNWLRGIIHVRATLNLEGFTLEQGELAPGMYGEGYIDRRHPHTFVHELMLSLEQAVGPLRWSVAAGKGFAPFGSDDPMSRPFVKYPINHHLAQILERAIAVVAVRIGPLALEGARFNGDEPEGPYDWPNRSRIGDSWSIRGTAWLRPGTELTASTARVASPEDAGGYGLDHRQSHLALRLGTEGSTGANPYLLVEGARTDMFGDGRLAFRFNSLLAEASAALGSVTGAVRFERTTRPDEQRLADVFRSPRPLLDFGIEGRSRWDAVSIALSSRASIGMRATLEPFGEVQFSRVRPTIRPTVFEPRDFYGSDRLWLASVGIRAGVPHGHRRVGRYGVARP